MIVFLFLSFYYEEKKHMIFEFRFRAQAFIMLGAGNDGKFSVTWTDWEMTGNFFVDRDF